MLLSSEWFVVLSRFVSESRRSSHSEDGAHRMMRNVMMVAEVLTLASGRPEIRVGIARVARGGGDAYGFALGAPCHHSSLDGQTSKGARNLDSCCPHASQALFCNNGQGFCEAPLLPWRRLKCGDCAAEREGPIYHHMRYIGLCINCVCVAVGPESRSLSQSPKASSTRKHMMQN